MVRGGPCSVHDAHAAAGFHGQRQHGRIARQRSHVVDDFGAGVNRVPSHQGLRGVDRNGQVGLLGKRPDDGHDAAKFFLNVDRLRAGAGALAADVEDVGPFGGQPQAMFHGGVGVQEAPAVGEAVRRDVDDAHQQRKPAEGERTRAEFPMVGGVNIGRRHGCALAKPQAACHG